MKITKNQLRRIIREEKSRLLKEERFTTDNRDFMDGMKSVIAGLMALPPEARIQNAESLIQNIETIIDVANKEMSGGPRNEGAIPSIDNMSNAWQQILGKCLTGKK